MKALYYTTASIYSQDYRRYGFFSKGDGSWHNTNCDPFELIEKTSSHGLRPCLALGDTDPRLEDGVRLSVLIERSSDQQHWFLAATVAGLRSRDRRDFNGRPIRDGLHGMSSGRIDDPARLQDAVQMLRGLCHLALDPAPFLDDWCSREAFEQDLIPFPSAEELWQHLSTLGNRALPMQLGALQALAVEDRVGLAPADHPARSPEEDSFLPTGLGAFLRQMIENVQRRLPDAILHYLPSVPTNWSREGPGEQRAAAIDTRLGCLDLTGIIELALKRMQRQELQQELLLFRLGSHQGSPTLRFSSRRPVDSRVLQAPLVPIARDASALPALSR